MTLDAVRECLAAPKSVCRPWELLAHLRQLDFAARGWAPIAHTPEYRIFNTLPARLQAFTLLTGDVFIGQNVRIGPFCFLRGPLIIGDNVTIGPHVELARSIVMADAKISHKNIVVDSIIGPRAHLAGFATTCNVCVGREELFGWYNGVRTQLDVQKYGSFIDADAVLGVAVKLMPGTQVFSGQQVAGPGIVFGNGEVRSCVSPKSG